MCDEFLVRAKSNHHPCLVLNLSTGTRLHLFRHNNTNYDHLHIHPQLAPQAQKKETKTERYRRKEKERWHIPLGPKRPPKSGTSKALSKKGNGRTGRFCRTNALTRPHAATQPFRARSADRQSANSAISSGSVALLWLPGCGKGR